MSLKLIISFVILASLGVGSWLVVDRENSGDPASPGEIPQSSRTNEDSSGPSRFADLAKPGTTWQIKVNQLRRLDPETLTAKDVDALFELLKHRPAPSQASSWFVVLNEIMERIRHHGLGRERIVSSFLNVAKDTTAHEVIRDYAVQHLCLWINPSTDFPNAPHEVDPGKISEVFAELTSLIQDPEIAHSSIPGTALKMFGFLASRFEDTAGHENQFAELEPWLRKTIAGELPADPSLRLSAINYAALIRSEELSPLVRDLARNEEINATLRLNAVAALGSLGNEDDKVYLTQLSTSGTRLSYAAKSALKRLSR